jgi:hypothetical protein
MTHDHDTIERLARALAAESGRDFDGAFTKRALYRDKARAILDQRSPGDDDFCWPCAWLAALVSASLIGVWG